MYARLGIGTAANLNQVQNVRAGAPAPLTATFTSPANGVGELLKAATAPGARQTAQVVSGVYYTPTDTTSGGVAFHSLANGTTTVDVSIPGYVHTSQATRTITTSQPTISVGAVTVGSGLQTNTSFTLGASNHGGVTVTLASSDPAILLSPNSTTPGTDTIRIPVANGTQSVGFYVQALEGRVTDTVTATVTVSAPGFSDGTALMPAVPGAYDLQGLPTTTTTLSPSNFLYARLGIGTAANLNQVQNVRAGAPAPITATFTSPANGVGELLKAATAPGASQTAQIVSGVYYSPTDTTSGGVAFHPLGNGTTTVDVTIPGYVHTSQAIRSITTSQPSISVGAVTVGSGLQTNTSFTLGASNHGGVTVTLASSDPAILLSPNSTTAGAGSIQIPVANGTQSVGFYVQALEGRVNDTVTATVTVSAPGFSDGTALMPAVPAMVDLQGLPTTTTTLSLSNFLYARLGIGTAANLNQVQNVRAGGPGPLTATFATPANGIGELLKSGGLSGVSQTAQIAPGVYYSPTDTTSGGVAFHSLLSGTTTVSVSVPGALQTAQAVRTITASQPSISVGSLTVGSGLQTNTSFTLGAPNHGNINIDLVSSNPALLLAPDATTPGADSIRIPVADGVQSVSFYMQGLEGQTGSVTATVTVKAPGFTNGTSTGTVVQGALDLQGLPTTTTPLTPSNFIYVRVGIPQSGNAALAQVQNLRAGAPGPLTATFTTLANGVAELLKSGSAPGVRQTALVALGVYYSPTDTTSGGVAFHPLGTGSTTVTAAIPGFVATDQAVRAITSATPTITIGTVTVGSGLQTNTSFTLGASAHGGVTVNLSSSDPAILLAPDASTPGTQTLQVPVANGVQSVGFYVQGFEGRTTGLTGSITAQATGFVDGTTGASVVPAAIDLQGVPATMASGAPDASIYARVGVPVAGNASLTQVQNVRPGIAGGGLTINFSTSNVNAASLIQGTQPAGPTQTLQIPAGVYYTATSIASGGVGLRRVSAGNSSISVSSTNIVPTGDAVRPVVIQ